jgi:hypothetical protein
VGEFMRYRSEAMRGERLVSAKSAEPNRSDREVNAPRPTGKAIASGKPPHDIWGRITAALPAALQLPPATEKFPWVNGAFSWL